jgi:gluconate kinase
MHSANQNMAYIHISWSTNKCFIRNVLRSEHLVPHDILAMTWMSTLENLKYTAAIVCNWFWHRFTSSVQNYGVIYAAQAPKL